MALLRDVTSPGGGGGTQHCFSDISGTQHCFRSVVLADCFSHMKGKDLMNKNLQMGALRAKFWAKTEAA